MVSMFLTKTKLLAITEMELYEKDIQQQERDSVLLIIRKRYSTEREREY